MILITPRSSIRRTADAIRWRLHLQLSRDDLDRFSAALGFCDLLSLCLCSGLAGSVQVPLSHPADPASRHADKVTIFLAGETVRLDPQIIAPGTLIHVDGWIALSPNVLASQRFYWTIA